MRLMDDWNMDDIKLTEMDGTDANTVPEAEKTSAETEQKAPEKTMSSMEKRMAEPFDMPGAYIPGEKYDPSNAPPRPSITPDRSGEYHDPAGMRKGREDALSEMYEKKQQVYEKGAKKAKILGIIVIVMALFDFLSSISSDYSDKIDNILAVASLAIMAYGSWKFMKGSNGCRSMLGILSLLDVIHAFRSGFVAVRAVNMLNTLFGSEISTAPYIFMAVVKAVVFGVIAYFFLLDSDISSFTTDD